MDILGNLLCFVLILYRNSTPSPFIELGNITRMLFGRSLLLYQNKSNLKLSQHLKGNLMKWKNKAVDRLQKAKSEVKKKSGNLKDSSSERNGKKSGKKKSKSKKYIKKMLKEKKKYKKRYRKFRDRVKYGFRRSSSCSSSRSSYSTSRSYSSSSNRTRRYRRLRAFDDSGCSSSSYSSRKRHRRHHSSSTTSSCVDNTIETLFPKKGRPLPKRDDVYFLDEKGGMKKSYGPFKDDESSPFYYPGLHQLDGKIGKRVLSDQEYRIHPSFMSKLADGGFYERRVIKPKDEKGADVVEERFGYFPKTGGNSNESDESSEYQPKKKRMGSNPDMSIFNAFMSTHPHGSGLNPYSYGTMSHLETKIDQEFEEMRKAQEGSRIRFNSNQDKLQDKINKETTRLENTLDTKITTDIAKKQSELMDDVDGKKNRKYSDDRIK